MVTEFVTNAGVGATGPADGMVYEPAFAAYMGRTATAFNPANAQPPDGVAEVIHDVLTSDAPPTRVGERRAERSYIRLMIRKCG